MFIRDRCFYVFILQTWVTIFPNILLRKDKGIGMSVHRQKRKILELGCLQAKETEALEENKFSITLLIHVQAPKWREDTFLGLFARLLACLFI